MLEFKLRIDCGNAAFEENMEGEIIQCLKTIIHNIESGGFITTCVSIKDTNGNRVGQYSLKEPE